MTKFKAYSTGLLLTLFLFSCKVSEPQNTSDVAEEVTEVEVPVVETPAVEEVPLALYKGERTRHFKLIHTRLEVSFNWEKQWLYGKALLMVEPYFYPQSSIVLDAKGFDIHEVVLIKGESRIKLNYEYDLNKLIIDLGKPYEKGERLNLAINYTAKPNENVSDDEFDITKKGL